MGLGAGQRIGSILQDEPGETMWPRSVCRRGGKEVVAAHRTPPPPCLTLSSRTQLCGLSPTLYNLRSTATSALRITVTSSWTRWKEPRVPGEAKASSCDRNRVLAVKDNVAEVTFPRGLGIYLS